MNLALLPGEFAICKVMDPSEINFDAPYCFFAKTDDERSLVCLTGDIPNNTVAVERGWRALKIEGRLDFSLVGILAGISAPLARAGISIFAMSTYNTDYILVRSDAVERACAVLVENGYAVTKY